MFGKFGSLLSFRGHSIGREVVRLLGAQSKSRRERSRAWEVAQNSEQLESRRLLTNTLDVNVSKIAQSQEEVSISVNPTNPMNLVVMSNGGDVNGNEQFIAFTMNGGQTWTRAPIDNLGDGVGGANSDRFDGAVRFDAFGNCHIIYMARNSLGLSAMVYGISANGGASFNTQVLDAPSANSDKPWITTGPDASNLSNQCVLVTFQDNTGRLVARSASSSGLGALSAFSGKVVYGNGGNYGVPAIGPNGQVAITWQNPAGGQSNGTVQFTSDSNGTQGGLNFGTSSIISATNAGGFDFIPATPDRSTFASPYLAYDLSNGLHRGRLYCAYADESPDESNNFDIFVRYSDNDGLTWSPPVRVNDDGGSNSQFFQNIAVDPVTGAVFLGWYDARNDNGGLTGIDSDGLRNTDVEFWGSQSTNGGLTFDTNFRISDGASNQARDLFNPNDFGDYIDVAMYNGVGYAVWADNSNSTGDNPNGNTNFDVYFDTVAFNLAPTIAMAVPGTVTVNEDTSTGPLVYITTDDLTLPANLTVTATSSNQSIIPNSGLVLGTSGNNSTITVTPAANASGTVTITLTVSDGSLSSSTTFDVIVLPLPDPLPVPPDTTLTTTTFDELTPTPIADNATTISSILTVSGLDPYLYDLNAIINISHPANGELSVVLISPSGTRVTLTSGNGGSFSNVFAGSTFDDQIITAPVTDYQFVNATVAPYLVPEGALAQLLGENPNGDWTLEVTDSALGNVGTLNSWSLQLTTVPAAPPLQTFSGNSVPTAPVAIPDNGTPLLLPLAFNGLDSFIWDVNLRLDVDHTNSGDLVISLISPRGTEILLSSGNGGVFDNIYNSTTFNDQASLGGPITDHPILNLTSLGSVIGEGALAGFLGENPNGTWQLKVVDQSATGTGAVVRWGLDITTIFVNDAPTLGTITNPGAISEDSNPVTIFLNSISAGGGENQPLQVTATSSNPLVIPNPTVNYSSPNNSGSLTYAPVADASGVSVITVTVMDGGYDQDLTTLSDNAFSTKTFVVVVNPVNDAPTLDPAVANDVITFLGNVTEDFGLLDVALTGISAGGGENQRLQLTAVSSQPVLISDPIIDYVQGANSAVMHVRSNPDYNGLVVLTVTIMDAGLDNDLLTLSDNLTRTRKFSLQMDPVNDPPTLAPITDPAPINEDSPTQTIVLSNITAGGLETQNLRITATSGDLSLISDVNVDYKPGNSTAPLKFRLVQNAFGSTTISVTVEDAGLDNRLDTPSDNLTITQVFNVTVNQVNDPPVFATLGGTLLLDEDPLPQLLNLSGISAGPLETQALSFTVSSSNPTLIPTPVLNYLSPGEAGTLAFNVAPNRFGSSLITVTLTDAGLDGDLLTTDDNQSFTRTLNVVVREINDPPTINLILDPAALNEGAGLQTISFSGITAGGTETQTLKVEAFSSAPAIIPNPQVSYVSGSPTGSLTFTPAPDQFGAVVISVRVTDSGLDGVMNTSDDGITVEEFTVTINSLNDAPSFDFIANPTAVDESPTPVQQTISISGISAGPNETQSLIFTVQNGDATKITDPVIEFLQGSSAATLKFTPRPSQFGVIPVTVTVTDPGQDEDASTTDDNKSYSQVFYVTVNAVNDPPTLDPISDPAAVDEDAGPQTIALVNVTPGPSNETGQKLDVTAVSSNPLLVTGFTPHFNGSGIPDSLTYTLGSNRSGTAVITVTVTDGGLDDNLTTPGDNKTVSQQFTVTVNSVNDAPSLIFKSSTGTTVSGNYNISEDAGVQVLTLSDITAGAFENQPVKITASVGAGSLNLITAPVVAYTSPETQGTLTFTPLANRSGTAVVHLKVEDGGPDGNLLTTNDNLFVVYDLNINVAEVNDPPLLAPISDPEPLLEDSGTQFITLTGISAGAGESQTLLIQAASSNPDLIPDPSIVYTDGSTTADLIFTPAPNKWGTAVIAVTIDDGHQGFIQRTFVVTVNPVNDAPTIGELETALTIDEDSGEQTIDLQGLSAGLGETGQLFSVSVTSNRGDIIPQPALIYTPQSATGKITFTPEPDQNGTVVLTVSVTDGGADGNLNTLSDNVTTKVNITVVVTPQPEVPVLTIDGGTALSIGGRATQIAPNATVEDADSNNFKHGSILVEVIDGARAGDRLSIAKFGKGSDRISATRSGLLKRGRSVIGSVSGGTGGTALVVSLNSDVGRREFQNIVRHLTFAGKGNELGLRRVQITITDNTGVQADPVERDIAVS